MIKNVERLLCHWIKGINEKFSHLIFRLEEIQIKVHNPQIHKSLIFNGEGKSISDLEIRVDQ